MGHTIPKGAAIYGRKELAVLLGFSEKSIRTALNHLKSANQVAIKTTNKFSIIQILNWEKYQQGASTTANKGPTRGQQGATDKEYKNIRIRDNIATPTDGRCARLEDLTLDHVAEWLAKQRMDGKYITIDEYAMLEMFKDYCLAKKPKYSDYTAAFRNSFRWSNAPQKQKTSRPDQDTMNLFLGR